MDPLHKTDSAISVASKDNVVYEGQANQSYNSQLHPPPSQVDDTDASSFISTVSDAVDSHLAFPSSSTQASTADAIATAHAPGRAHGQASIQDQAPASVSQSAPTPPSDANTSASANAMENLVPPLDLSQDGSRPPFVNQPASPWYQANLSHSTVDHAVDPRVSADIGASSTSSSGSGPDPYSQSSVDDTPGIGSATDDDSGPDALTQAGTGFIDVDHDQLELESDPGYESDRASLASTSLSSSVRDYLFENGRRYHRFREGRYNFPNDEAEQDREDMKHTCVKMLCQEKLFFAPLDEQNLHNILDIGTGTGVWAIEMGDQFPSANVLGIDLSPIQPDWVPVNVHFVVDDAESEWVHPPNHFDYIHTRHTVMAIKDWPKLYRTALEHLRPGGWIESQEIYHYPVSANNSMRPDHPVAQYWGLIYEGLLRLGIDFHACASGKIATMMRDAGFVNVQERILHVPLGTWPKNQTLKMVGEYWRHVLLVGAQAIALGPLTRGCGWTREQVEVFLIEVRKAYQDNSCLMYMPMYVTTGQKPEN